MELLRDRHTRSALLWDDFRLASDLTRRQATELSPEPTKASGALIKMASFMCKKMRNDTGETQETLGVVTTGQGGQQTIIIIIIIWALHTRFSLH